MKKISTKIDDELALLIDQEISKTKSSMYQFLKSAIEEKIERDQNSEMIDELKIALVEFTRRLEKSFEEKTIKLLEVSKAMSDRVDNELSDAREREANFKKSLVESLRAIDQHLKNISTKNTGE